MKAWYQSRAVWGELVAVPAAGAGAGRGRFQQRSWGAISGNAEAIVGAVIAVATGVGGVAAVVGRVKADSEIGKK